MSELPSAPPGHDWTIHADYDRTTVNLVEVDERGMCRGIVESHTFKHRDQFVNPQNITEDEFAAACADAANALLRRQARKVQHAQWADKLLRGDE